MISRPEKILLFGSWTSSPASAIVNMETACEKKIIDGRAMIVKSTGTIQQDNGFENRQGSRVLSAKEQWPEILRVSRNANLEIIVANARIVTRDLLKDRINLMPPFSFPGKLLAILFKRFEYFAGDPAKGLIIVSFEKDEKNNGRLDAILLELAHLNDLPPSFLDWIENANHFYHNFSVAK